jgi:hypothetical protein
MEPQRRPSDRDDHREHGRNDFIPPGTEPEGLDPGREENRVLPAGFWAIVVGVALSPITLVIAAMLVIWLLSHL